MSNCNFDNDLEYLLDELTAVESIDCPATIKFIPHPPITNKSPAQILNPKTKFTIIPSQSQDNLDNNDVIEFDSFDSVPNSPNNNNSINNGINNENSNDNNNNNNILDLKEPLSPNTFDSSDVRKKKLLFYLFI
jgi:hypothetical protein